ncbi:MAG: cysteine--tRNA ligase [bacterium]
MPLSLYNTLTRRRETFQPLHEGEVRIYSCGPTVYDYAHIGNWRANIFADLLRRYLRYRGFEVRHVMNLTDVDDKTIKGAREEGVDLDAYTGPYIEAFFEDLDTLRIQRVEVYPRATRHIPQMQDLVWALEENGYTYTSEGSVYFAVNRMDDYGKLSRLDTAGLREGARVDSDEYGKEEARDFVLWKGRKPEDGEVYWDSPWGEGRPGWHLECSAMSAHYLGNPFDIHTGGVDLTFPHHENEIAQTEGATGRSLAKWWLHNEHLMVEGEKMSKSVGNVHTLRDLMDEGEDPLAVRWVLMATHYRQRLNFKREGLKAAESSIARLREAARLWRERANRTGDETSLLEEARTAAREAREGFTAAMDADLNISEALAAVFDLVRRGNALLEEGTGAEGAALLLETLGGFDEVLAVVGEAEEETTLPVRIREMIEAREQARRAEDWGEADRLREALRAEGYIVEDTPDGSRWKRVEE